MTIAFAIFPEKTGAIGEVVGTKAIEACRKPWRRTGNPVAFPDWRPGKADCHVLVQMDFIDIDDDHFTTAHPFIQDLKLLDKVCSLSSIGFAQQFLALFPAQSCRSEHRA
jgi:hypothetical protein